MAFKKYRKSSKKTFKKRSYKKKSGGLTKPQRKAVLKIVKGQQETFQAGHIIETNTLHNAPISVGDCYPLIPMIQLGNADYERRGDNIRPVSLTVRGTVAFADDAVEQYTPCTVRVLVLEQRNIKTQARIGDFAAANLLKVNDSATTTYNKQFVGTAQDLLYPINTDIFIVHMDKLINLSPNYLADGSNYAPNQAFKRWSCTVKCPKKLHYASTSANLPDNFCPFVSVGYAYPNGHAPDTLTPTAIISNNFAVLKYKDA